ncbi:hypothetical protein J7382_02690 [Shimia sp. R11_0]|uniref:hypothetical protein n=1 Tax=Shimia sp. R11_0 TaxID=2821096 RepID=UPI001ADC1BD9|nr:hypothetical protein [Shimia sp. R11_0]MBO9476432.1 hypothetical protein [Shimia sp. R11_0]
MHPMLRFAFYLPGLILILGIVFLMMLHDGLFPKSFRDTLVPKLEIWAPVVFLVPIAWFFWRVLRSLVFWFVPATHPLKLADTNTDRPVSSWRAAVDQGLVVLPGYAYKLQYWMWAFILIGWLGAGFLQKFWPQILGIVAFYASEFHLTKLAVSRLPEGVTLPKEKDPFWSADIGSSDE